MLLLPNKGLILLGFLHIKYTLYCHVSTLLYWILALEDADRRDAHSLHLTWAAIAVFFLNQYLLCPVYPSALLPAESDHVLVWMCSVLFFPLHLISHFEPWTILSFLLALYSLCPDWPQHVHLGLWGTAASSAFLIIQQTVSKVWLYLGYVLVSSLALGHPTCMVQSLVTPMKLRGLRTCLAEGFPQCVLQQGWCAICSADGSASLTLLCIF